MAEQQDDLQRRLDNIVSGRSEAARRATPSAGLRAGAEAATAANAADVTSRPFSSFIPEDVQAAVELASEMMRQAEEAGGGDRGLAAALDAAEARLSAERGRGGLEAGPAGTALTAEVS